MSETLERKETGRIEAFSDGVFAIAITLLVLAIKVPKAADLGAGGNLLSALLALWPHYLAFVTSFALKRRLQVRFFPERSSQSPWLSKDCGITHQRTKNCLGLGEVPTLRMWSKLQSSFAMGRLCTLQRSRFLSCRLG